VQIERFALNRDDLAAPHDLRAAWQASDCVSLLKLVASAN
jgi:hypothetical protein